MKKKILVLCGGISKERLVSLDTGKQVFNELKKNKYRVLICEPDHNLLSGSQVTTLYLFFFNSLVTCFPVSRLISLSFDKPPQSTKIFFFIVILIF